MNINNAVLENKKRHKLPLANILHEGWYKVRGVKKPIFIASIIYILLSIFFGVVKTIYPTLWPTDIVSLIIMELLSAGLLYMGLRRAFDLSVTLKMLFRAFRFNLGLKIILTEFFVILIGSLFIFVFPLLIIMLIKPHKLELENLIVAVVYFFGFLIGFYFLIRLSLTKIIVMAQKTWPLKTILTSFRATKGNFWRFTGLVLISIILYLVSILTLGIALIWFLPYLLIVWGLAYKKLVADEL